MVNFTRLETLAILICFELKIFFVLLPTVMKWNEHCSTCLENKKLAIYKNIICHLFYFLTFQLSTFLQNVTFLLPQFSATVWKINGKFTITSMKLYTLWRRKYFDKQMDFNVSLLSSCYRQIIWKIIENILSF